jgi:hypothetical protein
VSYNGLNPLICTGTSTKGFIGRYTLQPSHRLPILHCLLLPTPISPQMAAQKPVYLNSFGGGLVLSHKNTNNPATAIVQFLDPKNSSQKWLVEYDPSQEGVIALKSCSNGEYLRANGGRNGSPCGTGAKAWWKMSWWLPVKHPFAFQLTSVEFPSVLLNHYQGRANDDMKVHMWRFEVHSA